MSEKLEWDEKPQTNQQTNKQLNKSNNTLEQFLNFLTNKIWGKKVNLNYKSQNKINLFLKFKFAILAFILKLMSSEWHIIGVGRLDPV